MGVYNIINSKWKIYNFPILHQINLCIVFWTLIWRREETHLTFYDEVNMSPRAEELAYAEA
ncbi:hypothetical protein BpHYR1_003240 [Brachionus plicatilis]|uniref:Uncharacterized protein n=1 Tax=Brachionus plicatilis TaxID=10195 RepID=A0A3M7RQX5_BRAPC|nr:hypothetical protein BpHYR1_003240 [Brachionus plicatilis]